MLKKYLTFLFLFIVSISDGQYAGFKAVSDTAAFRKKFASAASQLQSVQADFTQEKNLSMLTEKIVSNGKFYFKKDNKVRMEYLNPFQYLLVINKNNMSVKDNGKITTLSSKSNKLFEQISRIMVDCVQGTVFTNPDFKIRVFENQKSYLIEMSPLAKSLKEFFHTINIEADKNDYSVNSLNMIEVSGDNTLITFHKKELNKFISDEVFTVK